MSPAQVEVYEGLGFVVTVDGRPWPRTTPDQVCIFASLTRARNFADALDAEDTERCHRMIGKYGRFYRAKATV